MSTVRPFRLLTNLIRLESWHCTLELLGMLLPVVIRRFLFVAKIPKICVLVICLFQAVTHFPVHLGC